MYREYDIYDIRKYYNIIPTSKEFSAKNLNNFNVRNNDDKQALSEINQYLDRFDIKEGNGLCIFGPAGSGKTHLLKSIYDELCKKTRTIVMVNSIDVNLCFMQNKNNIEILHRLGEVSILLVDDFPRGTSDKGFIDYAALWYSVINTRYINKKTTFYTSNFKYIDIAKTFGDNYGVFIVDRIYQMNGKFIWLSAESYRRKK